MKAKIITKEQAERLGLATDSNSNRGGGSNQFIYGVVSKPGAVVNGKKEKDEVLEVHRLDIKTGKREILQEKPEYRALKQKLKINEYKE